jgi:hypothetical protein
MNWLSRVALRSYPPSFRSRYGPELSALVDALPASPAASIDLLLGAARAWLRPPVVTTQQRLQTTAMTTWIAWCAGFLVAPATNWALLDPPTAGVSGPVHVLLTIAFASFVLGWALVLIGAAPVVVRAVVPALRGRRWAALRPMLPTAALGGVEAAGVGWLALTVHARGDHLSAFFVVTTVLWLIGFGAFVCSLGIGPAVSLARLAPGEDVLRVPTYLAAPVAITLAAMTGCSLAAVLVAGDATLVSSSIPVGVALAVASLAALTALVSSSRGLHTLRSRKGRPA